MRSILRKLRGAVGTAVTWAVMWATGGVAFTGLLFLLSPGLNLQIFAEAAPAIALVAGAWGFIGGGVFSLTLGTVHRSRRLDDLSPGRMSLWGALAGMLLPIGLLAFAALSGVTGIDAEVIFWTTAIFGGLGATTAGGTVKLAQSASQEIDGTGPGPLLEGGP